VRSQGEFGGQSHFFENQYDNNWKRYPKKGHDEKMSEKSENFSRKTFLDTPLGEINQLP